jgi:hypothetical protein
LLGGLVLPDILGSGAPSARASFRGIVETFFAAREKRCMPPGSTVGVLAFASSLQKSP